jgi:hypothetical protein
MPAQPISGIRGLWALLLGSLLSATACAPAAQAISGFTGSFRPAKWSKEATYGGTSYSSIPETCAGPPWSNLNPATVYVCLDFDNLGGSALLGARPFVNVTGQPDTETTASISLTNNSRANYFVSFNAELIFSAQLGGTGTATISLNDPANPGSPTVLANLTDLNPTLTIPGSSMATISPNWTLTFKVTAPIIQTDDVFIYITDFDGQVVPSPVPAAGAASVFAFSRRLRRRTRMGSEQAGRPPTPRPAPYAYLFQHLNLSEDGLAQIPLSFDYMEADSTLGGSTMSKPNLYGPTTHQHGS